MKVQEGKFKGHKELPLYYCKWLPDGSPKAVFLFCHGATLHSGFYTNMAVHLTERGFAVYAPDLRGHGKSEGPRCYMARFEDYLLDLQQFVDQVKREQPGRKIFLGGHSMGSYIEGIYTCKHQDEIAGLMMASAGTIGSTLGVPKVIIAMAGLVSAVAPRLGVNRLNVAGFSRDQAIVDAYINDPLVYHGRMPARWGAEMLKMLKELPSQMREVRIPVLIMHGTGDWWNMPDGSREVYNLIASSDKTLKLYDGLYHDIFNEPEKIKVMDDLVEWLQARL
jgi:lysophospholipase